MNNEMELMSSFFPKIPMKQKQYLKIMSIQYMFKREKSYIERKEMYPRWRDAISVHIRSIVSL